METPHLDLIEQTIDMKLLRSSLSLMRNDWKTHCPDRVLRISTVLPCGITYAEFALYHIMRSLKTKSVSAKPKRKNMNKPKTMPVTRKTKITATEHISGQAFREIVGVPKESRTNAPIDRFIIKKKRKKSS